MTHLIATYLKSKEKALSVWPSISKNAFLAKMSPKIQMKVKMKCAHKIEVVCMQHTTGKAGTLQLAGWNFK